LLLLSPTHAAQVRLAWDPPTTNTDSSPLTDLAGYKLHVGQNSGAYTSVINVGNVTTFTLTTGLVEGRTYYLAVTAYDTVGNASSFSNELTVTIPTTPEDPPDSEEPPPSGHTTLVAASFATTTDGFQYVDDAFRGTALPQYAVGTYNPTDGVSGGALEVVLGGVDGKDVERLSGGWRRSFTLPTATDVTLAFRYHLSVSAGMDTDEYGEVLVAVDGQLLGAAGQDYVARLYGKSTGNTGWQVFERSLGRLAAGTHTVVLGGYNNKKTSVYEWVTILLDEVQLTAAGDESMILPVANVTASAAQDPNVPANTLDDDLGTRWSAQGKGQWIRYDLGAVYTVSHVAIAWYRGNDRIAVFDIEASRDGEVWTTVHTGTSSGLTSDLETYDVDDMPARFVRLVGFGNSSNTWNSITEVMLKGY
jgi:hypothetical protein